jgi:chromosome segregation ATPase
MPNGDCAVGSANSARIEAAQATLNSALHEIQREREKRDRADRELADLLHCETEDRRKADKGITDSLRKLEKGIDDLTDWKKLVAAALAFLVASGAGSAIATIIMNGGTP